MLHKQLVNFPRIYKLLVTIYFMVKLKDIFSENFNKCNYQKSFNIKKRKLKEFDLDIDDILETEIKKKNKIKWS